MVYENHHIHHDHRHFYQQNLHIHHRSTFLPILCSRSSIKDVSLPRLRDRDGSFSDEPLSPRIGCMGQVKRNNKIAGFPTSRLSFTAKNGTAASTTTTSPGVKYSKLKKLFSGRNLSSNTIPNAPSVSSCGSRQKFTVNGEDVKRNNRCSNKNCGSVSIEDMDPPLPVIKRVQKSEEERQVDSLWKRRSGGTALKSLQLQQIQHPRHHLQPTSVWYENNYLLILNGRDRCKILSLKKKKKIIEDIENEFFFFFKFYFWVF